MHKLLIAEPDRELRLALTEELADDFLVLACDDGEKVRRAIEEFRPDLMVLNLLLPAVDGLTLLRELSKTDIAPALVVTTPFASAYILDALHKCNVDYPIMQPYSISAMHAQLLELSAMCAKPSLTQEIPQRDALPTLLLELGFAPKADGFGYLLQAIPLFSRDRAQGLTKELYTAVGHAFGKSGQLVERSIRSAVQSAWSRGDTALWRRYFPPTPDGRVSRPTNGDFIARIATLFPATSESSLFRACGVSEML